VFPVSAGCGGGGCAAGGCARTVRPGLGVGMGRCLSGVNNRHHFPWPWPSFGSEHLGLQPEPRVLLQMYVCI